MEDHTILYQHHTKDGKVRKWEGWVEGREYHTRHGILDGIMTPTMDIPGSKGKEGTKSFVTPEAQAKLVLQRTTKKKRDSGYVGEGESPNEDSLDLSTGPLPKNVCFPKPLQEIPEKLVKQYGGITDLDFCFTRKRDGEMAPIVRTDDGMIRIYSRRMDEIQDKFPHLVGELSDWMPNGTILLGELVNPGELDDRPYVASILRSKTEKALTKQEEKGGLWFYVFSVFAFGGQPLWHTSTMEQILHRVGLIPESEHVKQVELLGVDNLGELEKVVLEESWEGAVVYLRDGQMEERDVRLAGKASRPKVSWKWKPIKEMDLIIMDWDLGSGDNQHRLGTVQVGAYIGGELTAVGWCGTGFSREQRTEWADDSVVGKVVEVRYDDITSDQKLLIPRFIRFRPDKQPQECVWEY